MKTSNVLRLIPFLVLMGAGCSSLLGIEDVYEDEKPGGGESGDGGNGGTSGANGGTSGANGGSSGDAGSAGTAGRGGASGSSNGGGSGGTSGDAGGGGEGDVGGGDSGGSSGSGGSGGTPDPTVRGKLVTTWMQPIPNTTIFLTDPDSGETLGQADTDDDGEFVVEDVPDEYDAKFVVNYPVNNPGDIRTYGWAYLGLTRRDPTLQVYGGLPYRSGNYAADPNDLTATSFDNLRLGFGIGGPDGNTATSISLPNGIAQSSSGWQGPATTNVTGHALLMELDVNDIPTAYHSYDQQLAVLSESVAANFVFSVPNEAITSGILQGTVTSASQSDRTNYVHLRFETNASIELVEQYGADLDVEVWSYLVPTITGASIEVAAVEGTWSFGPAACAHRDRLAAMQSNVAIEIPTPPVQVAPIDGLTNVDGSTQFTWTSQAETFVLFLDNYDVWSGLYIVTAGKQTSIPSFPNGFQLIPGDVYNWRVETHGSFATVDEMAGPEGFVDSWAPYCEGVENPRRGDGQYAISAGRLFTMAE
jgi:hypothetical protein